MSYHFENLDNTTRAFMLRELGLDEQRGHVYLSDRLNAAGQAAFPGLLREALAHGSEVTLARSLHFPQLFNTYEKQIRNGHRITAKVGPNAPELLAADQFNRYYIRGVCARALEEFGPTASVVIYRAKSVSHPRPESQSKIGRSITAASLLEDLRTHHEKTRLGIPSGPLSGISVRLADRPA